jgi:hypothetical protein
MPAIRCRRILRRAVIALVGTVLLLTSYVLSCGGVYYYVGRHLGTPMNASVATTATHFCAPLVLYSQNEWPGARLLETFTVWCSLQGTRHPPSWHRTTEIVEKARRLRAER